MPVPSPTTTPHSRISCHGSAMIGLSATAPAVAASDRLIVRRTPNRSIAVAANGPIMP